MPAALSPRGHLPCEISECGVQLNKKLLEAWEVAQQPVTRAGGDNRSARPMQDTPTAVLASGIQGVTFTQTRESARGGLGPWMTDPRKRRRPRWVDSPSNKWAGQLQGRRSLRTATSWQGEM